ncbi:glycerophosphodiester phosphodiesterase [Nocardioides sp. zg-536]|uniref:Glycerophosphodiester phosphodiesterase n=1 Tax=Nocardioides faecalis TaxID=2803858 RepID=A0A938Y2E4_9ACTN|nr:glycerophosphodiester phosphodiesterase family protein [Nocardioides faecalis]MBM9458703.1 glycerophosphodiester phosphodiesterase [Nocardioides faecalis]MBS4753037.1 glycerophosphodiester phosphodiesterase [Nocardioides faecalis]QVI58692.1 glycerophosphodiester phosphodiesterase [Nocardioides faecalis]
MRPQVVAHRGASHEHAEHTLKAYLEALDAGAGGLECDVRLTADGHLVCVHDRDLRRIAATRGLVSTMDLAELSQLDFATWKNPWADMDDEAPEPDETLSGVLTLRKLLETVADYDRPVEMAIETKHPTRYGGLVEKRLVEMLRDFGWDRAGSPVRVMSFSFTALQRVERLAPEVQLVQLFDKPNQWPMLRRVIGRDWRVGPGIDLLRQHPRLRESLARSGRDVHVWVVNTAAELEVCLELGVKAVISDRPRYISDLLDRREGGGADPAVPR